MSSDICSSYCSFSKNWCKTQTQLHEVEFDWVIDNFDFHEAKGTELRSSTFSATTNDKFKWCLSCKPNGTSEQKDTFSIRLHLFYIRDPSESAFGKLTVSLLDYQQNVIKTKSTAVRKYSMGSYWGWSEFLKKDERFKNKLKENNTLTIHCSVKFSEMNDVDVSIHQCKPIISSCRLSNDLAILLDNQEFSDVILSVNGKEYKTHKNILSARSPVFAAMFRHNTTETELNRVVIEDINEDVVGEMLKYIYTGKCDLNEFADGLLVAADKYALDQLKIMCMEELCRSLSAENASNILILADLHSVKELKIEIMKFIVANFADVSNTTGWQNILSKSLLVDEVCRALACR